MPLAAGTRIGPYEIVSWLGAGGMGVVYRARDARLGRDVALKLIPDSLSADETRVRRFEQEARAAGQLNHPNILAVHDVGEHQGSRYIVTELLEGETLRDRLARGALAPRKAVDFARQTANGLAAAHDKAIVHRDVKPDNLFITADERVKILDFGIAKLTTAGDGSLRHTGQQTETAEGIVVGTAGYMSPEQVRGEAVDARSDIFSVGAVLHEMLTGRAAFTRDTAADTMAAILKEEPRERLPSTVSPALERIVSRCLEKARETRYQSARDLAFGLEVLSDTGATAVSGAATARPRRTAMVMVAGVVGLVVVALAIWLTPPRTPPPVENPLAEARVSRLTNWPGTETDAAISPDGRFVAFVADHEGEFDLFLNQVDTGNLNNLTKNVPPLSAAGILATVGFSADGGEVWYTEGGDSGAPKWLIPLTGGTPRAFLGLGAATPAWSPDGHRLAYFNNASGDQFYLADGKGADARPLTVAASGFFGKTMHSHNPAWSSDGQWIYFTHGAQPEELNVWRVRPSGEGLEQLTAVHAQVNYVAPIDPRTVLYTADSEDGSGPWLWSLDVESKVTRRVMSGLEHYASVSASRDGRRVVATVQNPTATLWSVSLENGLPEERDAKPYPLKAARAFAPRFKGESLYFLSSSGGGDSLWLAKGGQESQVWKSADDSLTEPPAVSPDGSRLAIVVRQEGKQRLLVMNADGTNARTLAPSVEIHLSRGRGSVDWSPDGTWIVAAGNNAQGEGLFKIPLDGAAPVPLVSGQVVNPVISPDGTLIVYGGPVVAGTVPILGVRPDGTPVKMPQAFARIGGGYRFLTNQRLVYLARAQTRDFYVLDLATKENRPITHLGDQGTLNAFDITPDGKQIVFDRSKGNSDIYLIELPRVKQGTP